MILGGSQVRAGSILSTKLSRRRISFLLFLGPFWTSTQLLLEANRVRTSLFKRNFMELRVVEVCIRSSSGGEGWVEASVAVAASSLSSLLLFLTPDLPFIPIVTVKLCCRWTRQGTAEECEV